MTVVGPLWKPRRLGGFARLLLLVCVCPLLVWTESFESDQSQQEYESRHTYESYLKYKNADTHKRVETHESASKGAVPRKPGLLADQFGTKTYEKTMVPGPPSTIKARQVAPEDESGLYGDRLSTDRVGEEDEIGFSSDRRPERREEHVSSDYHDYHGLQKDPENPKELPISTERGSLGESEEEAREVIQIDVAELERNLTQRNFQ